MADDTKNYNIVINTEVKGDEDLKNLNSEIEETATKFQRLQTQIKETKVALQQAQASGDEVAFKKLKSQLDELEDGFEKVNNKSKQLDDQLTDMPGTLGQVGSSIKQVDGTMKMLSANPILIVLGAVAGAFMLVKKSLESTKEGTAALSKITDAFGAVIKPIFEWISAVAVPVLTGFANGIQWLGTAIGLIDENSNKAKTNLDETTQSIAKLNKEIYNNQESIKAYQKSLDETSIIPFEKRTLRGIQLMLDWQNAIDSLTKKNEEKTKERLELESKLPTNMLANELAITKGMSDQEKERDIIKRQYAKYRQDLANQDVNSSEQIVLLNEDMNKKLKEIDDKYNKQRKSERDKRNAERLANQTAANQVYQKALLSQMDEQGKELKTLENQFIAEQKILRTAGLKDTSVEMLKLVEVYEQDKIKIKDKYNKIEFELDKKKFEDELAALKEATDKIVAARIKSQTDWLNEYNAMADNESLTREERFAAIETATSNEIRMFKEANGVTIENQTKFQNQINAITKKGSDKRLQIIFDEIDLAQDKFMGYVNMAADFGSLLENISAMTNESSEKGFEAGKTLSIASVVVSKAAAIADIISSTMAANAKAVALFPLTSGAPWVGINTASAAIGVASTIATAASSISEIKNSKFGGGSSSGGGVSLPVYPSAPIISAPEVSVNQQDSVGVQISNTLNNSQKSPQKVYVTSQDVSSNQQLDRRTKSSASF